MVTPLPIILSWALSASVRAAEGQTIQVPGAAKHTGAAWLRAWVTIERTACSATGKDDFYGPETFAKLWGKGK